MNKPQEVTSSCPHSFATLHACKWYVFFVFITWEKDHWIQWKIPNCLCVSTITQNDHWFFFSFCRLLDICHGQRHQREMSLYLVFEHVHQDLATYLENCPSPGLGQDRIKVRAEFFF